MVESIFHCIMRNIAKHFVIYFIIIGGFTNKVSNVAKFHMLTCYLVQKSNTFSIRYQQTRSKKTALLYTFLLIFGVVPKPEQMGRAYSQFSGNTYFCQFISPFFFQTGAVYYSKLYIRQLLRTCSLPFGLTGLLTTRSKQLSKTINIVLFLLS